MKKLMKLLALALAVVMLLPAAALAEEDGGEESGKELLIQWISWDEDPQPEGDIEYNSHMVWTPYDELRIAFYTNEKKPIPVDKVEVSDGLIVQPLCPGVKGKEHYAHILFPEEWNKEYTISYEGSVLTLETNLPDIGLYSAPEASVANYKKSWGFSPVMDEKTAYIISTSADETHGRHLVNAALSKTNGDSDAFQLEKVSDNVYKVTLTGSVDVETYQLRVDVTWENAKFLGGETYTEEWAYDPWQQACLLLSDKQPATLDKYDPKNPDHFYDQKEDYYTELTLKAGESKTAYTSITYFSGGDINYWVVHRTQAVMAQYDDALKVTFDEKDESKLTISSDVPGTYTLVMYNNTWPAIDALYHKDGKEYTEAEYQKFEEEVTYTNDPFGQLIVITDLETWENAPFAEVFPDVKVEYHIVRENPHEPVIITVEPAEPEKLPFTDVDEGIWYEKAVRFVNSKGYMNGDNNRFNPDGKITTEEFAQLLYNIAGKPAAADGAAFQGVTDQWYAAAMLWAAGEGIITDTGDTAVALGADLTRQQLAMMLYNSLGKPEGTADLSAFDDAGQISDWAKPAMEWAVSAKVFQGGDGKLAPTDPASRAEVAQLLLNYFG